MHLCMPNRPNPVRLLRLALMLMITIASGSLSASGITINPTGSMTLGAGVIDLACGDLVVGGTTNLSSGALNNIGNVIINGGTINGNFGTIHLTGNWANNGGTLVPDSSQVTFNENCGSGVINVSGDSAFNNLTLQDSARQITFESGSTTSVDGHLILTGNGGNLLKIRSDAPGLPAYLIVNDSYQISQVDVRDNHAQLPGKWIDPGQPSNFNSIDSGGNFRWFLNGAAKKYIPVPTLGNVNPTLMVLLILGIGMFVSRQKISKP